MRAMLDAEGGGIDDTLSQYAKHIGAYTSSADELKRMIAQGPSVSMGAPAEQYKLAMDSFTIGSSYAENRTSSGLAVPWFEQGAAQQQGFGLMSQLALGQIYANGQGVPQNMLQARYNFQRAQQSLYILMNSNNPQAKQILKNLPVTPRAVQEQIEHALHELQYVPKE